ncbi:MAG: Na/Pi cotransporter family protein [Candidatus Borkfalkiaceae bacterium]|nr:Na/Pi cotransporter family protein [Christensenellaceae bacterium]
MQIQFGSVYQVILCMLASLGAFLVGFKILSENLQSVANKGLRKLFDRTSKSKLAGVGIGVGATVLMQSSSATTVMVIGFVNAGMMCLSQATAIIMGANIGTTITTILIAVGLSSIGPYVMALAFIGIFGSMLCRNDKAKSWFLVVAGFGLVFFGLTFISSCMKSDIIQNSEFLRNILRMAVKPAWIEPIALLLVGAVITAIMQASTAVNGIILAMLASGIQIGSGGNALLFIVLGTNIGTCVTALLSSVGAGTNAKRAALIHLLFNLFGAVLFLIVLCIWKDFMDGFWTKLIPGDSQMQMALFHLAFNTICTIVFFPMTNLFVRITELVIRDKKEEEKIRITYMDDRMLATPTVAIAQLQKEAVYMGNRCMKNLRVALEGFLEKDVSAASTIASENEEINIISKQITDYLIKVSGTKVSVHDDTRISILYHAIGDMLRISEISENVTKYTRTTVEKGLAFSDDVMAKIRKMGEQVDRLYELAIAIFETKNRDGFPQLEILEDGVDEMRKQLIDEHIKRLNDGACNPANSAVFINLVSNLERAGDHITFIAHSIDELQ